MKLELDVNPSELGNSVKDILDSLEPEQKKRYRETSYGRMVKAAL